MIEKITGILNELDTEELRELQEIIDNTLETRKKTKKERKWREVVEAMTSYSSAFGSIEYHICGDEFYIHPDDDYSTIGKIFSGD